MSPPDTSGCPTRSGVHSWIVWWTIWLNRPVWKCLNCNAHVPRPVDEEASA